MTSNEETSYIAPELMNSQYDVGMQNKKMERQAVKGLTPKYCYATMSADQVITVLADINLNVFETNDNRMSATNWRIIIPQTWIWLVTMTLWHQDWVTGSLSTDLLRNWSSNVWSTTFPFQVWAFNSFTPTTVISKYFITVPLLLQQWDYLRMNAFTSVLPNLTIYKEKTQLRVISYILY